MYADDTALLCPSNMSNDSVTLQSEVQCNLINIAKWFADNLTRNIKKTKVVLIGTRHTLENVKDISLHHNQDEVEHVDEFKYLGVTFDLPKT